MTAGPLDALEQAVAEALANTLPAVVDRLAAQAGPRAYSVAQVAERLDLSETTIRKLIRDGHLRTVPHLNPQRIAATALDEFLSTKTRRPLRSAS
jgi:excisionase family DNA binding protein